MKRFADIGRASGISHQSGKAADARPAGAQIRPPTNYSRANHLAPKLSRPPNSLFKIDDDGQVFSVERRTSTVAAFGDADTDGGEGRVA